MAMKLVGFSVTYDYKGTLRAEVSFSGDGKYISAPCSQAEVTQIDTIIQSIQSRLLDEAAAQLIQARDDLLAIEHRPAQQPENPASAMLA